MELETLVQRPESQRDDAWEKAFLEKFIQMKVQVEGDQAKAGPDGWPYLFVRANTEGAEPVPDILQWLAAKGIGLVVNAHKMIPDYVFPYGMIWNFIETGRFTEPPQPASTAGEVVYSAEKKLVTGPPSDKYLPPYVRGVIREFLQSRGFPQPKVLVVSSADFRNVDLIFAVNSLLGLKPNEHKALAEKLAWFLPLHYTLVLGEEAGLPPFHIL